ncbi:MAG TPA: proline--tRNA ligase [Pyrinomonadaceae bacterium]|nr:proline--tRNA ligase [Pyrinomonadaceae bacterium]
MAITKRSEDYSQWYLDIIKGAKLAEHSPVKGCMVIRPNGFAIWEKMQRLLDDMLKETGHVNAYFPLFIPKSFLSKEAEHVEHFAKECAIVTHYRLKAAEDGSLVVDENAKLEEELVIRPTSETIIWSSYKNWIQSYRDLPLLINQWANVVRWEMRTRLFLRTAEFLWQEGHTAHRTYDEAEEEALLILGIYKKFAEEFMAMPVYVGVKTESEKFAGADHTYTIEAMMQDKKALQAGTSHHLGQNFAKAFDVKYRDEDGEQKYVWATSWAVTTRLLGALIMTHSDDKGLVLPPKLATKQVSVVPIWRTDDARANVIEYSMKLKAALSERGITSYVDDRDDRSPGWKFNESELNGIPLRLELGPKEVTSGTVVVCRRDTGVKESFSFNEMPEKATALLADIQTNLFNRAREFRDSNTFDVQTYDEAIEVVKTNSGFARAFWNGSTEGENKLKNIQASVRCLLSNDGTETGKCIVSGENATRKAIIGKSY